MYNSSDPRASLATARSGPAATEFAAAEYLRFYETAPQVDDADGRTWLGRGQNFLVAYSEANAGATFVREAQPDEYVVLLPESDTPATITWNGVAEAVPGHSIVFVPPGDSTVVLPQGGRMVRMFTTRSKTSPRPAPMPRPTRRRIRTSRPSCPGRSRAAAGGCAPIRSTCRTSRAASAASGAAPPSW
jgi:hypothetical protein